MRTWHSLCYAIEVNPYNIIKEHVAKLVARFGKNKFERELPVLPQPRATSLRYICASWGWSLRYHPLPYKITRLAYVMSFSTKCIMYRWTFIWYLVETLREVNMLIVLSVSLMNFNYNVYNVSAVLFRNVKHSRRI